MKINDSDRAISGWNGNQKIANGCGAYAEVVYFRQIYGSRISFPRTESVYSRGRRRWTVFKHFRPPRSPRHDRKPQRRGLLNRTRVILLFIFNLMVSPSSHNWQLFRNTYITYTSRSCKEKKKKKERKKKIGRLRARLSGYKYVRVKIVRTPRRPTDRNGRGPRSSGVTCVKRIYRSGDDQKKPGYRPARVWTGCVRGRDAVATA